MSENGYAISTHSLTKRFGRKLVLDGIDVHVPAGAVYGLLGPNGVGKTTFVRILLNLINPNSGSASVLGLDVVQQSVAVRQRVGHVAALQPLWEGMRVQEYVGFIAGCYPRWNQEPASAILSRVGIEGPSRIGQLSRGQRALVCLAATIGHDPEVLLLDEALTGLDPISRREVLRSIIDVMHSEGRTVFVTGQDIGDMERICDHIGFLVKGKLVLESGLDELKSRVKRIRVEHPQGKGPPIPPGALNVRSDTRETYFTVAEVLPPLLEALSAPDRRVEVMDLSLEDIFVDLVQPQVEVRQ